MFSVILFSLGVAVGCACTLLFQSAEKQDERDSDVMMDFLLRRHTKTMDELWQAERDVWLNELFETHQAGHESKYLN
jgi:hypothetical protein